MSVYDFLKEHNMLAECCDSDALKACYKAAMKTGRGLAMIPSYHVVKYGELPAEDLLSIDAGGTNLRFALYRNGELFSERKMPMFGTRGPITADEFFDFMAAEIDRYDARKVGLSFAYPCEILQNRDARILHFSKEVNISGEEGRIIGLEINKRLKKKRQFSVLNDTVAAQLGVSADAAIILGTGFNISYMDKEKGMIICTESGRFEQLPQGTFDKLLCDGMDGVPLAERQISGAYLGLLIRIAAEAYFGRELPDFELSDVSEFLIGEGSLYDYLSIMEKREFRNIISLLLERSANRVALMLECLLEGRESADVALEGSTVYKLPGYFEALKEQTEKIPGLSVNFIDARGTISLGCVRSLI